MAMVSVREAAARLGCSTQYLGRLLAGGRISGTRVGRTWNVDVDSLEQFIAHRESTGTGTVPVVSVVTEPRTLTHEPRHGSTHASSQPALSVAQSAPRTASAHSTAGHSTAAHTAAAHPAGSRLMHQVPAAGHDGEAWQALARENQMLKASVAHLTAALVEVSAAMGPLVESRSS